MPSDPTKPLLRLVPQADQPRQLGRAAFSPSPAVFSRQRQTSTFGPKFTRLAEVLARGDDAMTLRADPTGLAPERLLVFEVRGSISAFAAAVQNVAGLELIDEEELESDEGDTQPYAYLLVPDVTALRNLESLWRRWQNGELQRGETPWANVFDLLRDLRPWGPVDRVDSSDASFLAAAVDGLGANDLVRLEVELVYRQREDVANAQETNVRGAIVDRGGAVISRARITDIGYHALLVDVPSWAVGEIVNRRLDGIAGLEPVLHIRPQSEPTSIEVADVDDEDLGAEAPGQLGEPILALLDGVPIAAHRLLADYIDLDDPFNLEPGALVANRSHGTAMASLIIHGDRNQPGASLPRRIHVVPVMGNNDRFPSDRLVVDLIYLAVQRLREARPGVVIVNLSLGNRFRPFHGKLSPWARLLDRLANRFGLLFIVSAGNATEDLGMPAFATSHEYEEANADQRAAAMIEALQARIGERRMISPAETVNGITVGAYNRDSVSPADRALARVLVDPYPSHEAANPSSSLGPGFARSVKPDILMPGAREHMQVVRNHTHIDVRPARASRGAGLKVAAPPAGGRENLDGYTNGTSAAAALASRVCHQIHDALEANYGNAFLALSTIERAVLLKALLVHPARWPRGVADLIKATVGPWGRGQASKQKDNIRRFIGFGSVDATEAVACAADRATFFATGSLRRDRSVTVQVPVPVAIGGKARPHSLSATLAWFTPVAPGRKSYRTCRLKILKPASLGDLGVDGHGWQPDENQTNRGTVFSRCWEGDHAPAVTPSMSVPLIVQRDPDQGAMIDEPVVFGIAVTITMPGEVALYDELYARVTPPIQATARP